jgi:hypothetical protein
VDANRGRVFRKILQVLASGSQTAAIGSDSLDQPKAMLPHRSGRRFRPFEASQPSAGRGSIRGG